VLGYFAGYSITNSWNTALGNKSLFNTTGIGAGNVALGFQAGYFNTSGQNNISIGPNAGPASGGGTYNNSIAIGNTANLYRF